MDKNRPARVIRFGRVKVTIWANEGPHGPSYSVRVCRVYKVGDAWKQTNSLGRDEIPLVCKALDRAHTWIYAQSRSPRTNHGMKPASTQTN